MLRDVVLEACAAQYLQASVRAAAGASGERVVADRKMRARQKHGRDTKRFTFADGGGRDGGLVRSSRCSVASAVHSARAEATRK